MTIGYPDQIDSETSLAALDLSLGDTSIAADLVMARAMSANGGTSAITNIDALTIDGVAVAVTGAPNQHISIPGGVVVLNEQQRLSDGTLVVNALHATVSGVADVVVASAQADRASTAVTITRTATAFSAT